MNKMGDRNTYRYKLPVRIARESANLNITAISELLEFYEPYIKKCVNNLHKNNSSICEFDLEDLLQNIHLKIVEGIPQFRKRVVEKMTK